MDGWKIGLLGRLALFHPPPRGVRVLFGTIAFALASPELLRIAELGINPGGFAVGVRDDEAARSGGGDDGARGAAAGCELWHASGGEPDQNPGDTHAGGAGCV